MTNPVLFVNEWRNMILKVEAGDPRAAHEVVEWIVEHRNPGEGKGIPVDEVTKGDWSP